MAELVEVLMDAGLQIVTILVGAVVTWIAVRVQEWLKAEGNASKLKQKESYAKLAVEAVELIFNEANGAKKLAEAKNRLLDYAEENNLPIGEQELQVLIESAVMKLKAEGKEIKNIYDEQIGGLTKDE